RSLRLAGRAGGVEEEQRVLGVDDRRLSSRALPLDGRGEVDPMRPRPLSLWERVRVRAPWPRRQLGRRLASPEEDGLDAWRLGQRLGHDREERNGAAAAVADVGRDDDLGAGVED